MKTLRAPEGVLSVATSKGQHEVCDGLLEDLDDDAAAEVMAHDPRFVPHNDGEPLLDHTKVAPEHLSRKDLFAALRKLGVAATATLRTEDLRAILEKELKKQAPATGATGATGQGSTGASGAAGAGTTGTAGATGDAGSTAGASGASGETGGATGAAGATGANPT